MGDYTFPLYFDARKLTDKEAEKVRTHFQKKRVSGGGECGFIEQVGGNCYKISFLEKEDQERVLQRKFHNISLPGGELRLTVSRSLPDQTFDQAAAAPLTQTFKKSNTKCLEKTFPLDLYLLMYLRDNPKAARVLDKQLASIGCTAESNLDEEWVVVRGDVEKGPGGAFGGAAERWEEQVDRVMVSFVESYACHHCVEPKHSKMLLQDLSFLSDDMKVYTDPGYAVMVGEAEAVKGRVAILTKSLPIREEVPVAGRHFKLVEEEFSREMASHHPDVKISRGRDLVVLEGVEGDVRSGRAKLAALTAKIKQKSVLLPTALMDFVVLSGAGAKYQACFQQSLRRPVDIEVGSELVLSGLSQDALEEAEDLLKKDLSVVNVQLQGAAAVPPHLDRVRDMLSQAKAGANRDELRVEVSFIPGLGGSQVSKVRLVGYSQNVDSLKSKLQDFQMNQIMTQEVCTLSNPQLVDCFDQVLKLVDLKPTDVTLKASHSPNPRVVVSGPNCKVQEFKAALTSALARLTFSSLVFKGPGAQRFFQAEGKVSKELVESSCQVIVREEVKVQAKARSVSNPVSPTAGPPASRGHSGSLGSGAAHNPSPPNNKADVVIKLGSLEHEQVNVLVVPMTNKQLLSTYIGISLSNKAGNTLKPKFDSLASSCTLAHGNVLQLDAPPTLGCSKIYFIECLPWDGVQGRSVQALRNGLKTCFDLCVQQNFGSIALTVIGLGKVLKYPLNQAVQVLSDTLCSFGSSVSPGSLSTVHIVIKPGYPDSEECYCEVIKQLSSNMNRGGRAVFRSLSGDLDDIAIRLGGGVKLRLIFGDITDETTDAVVNSTDFQNFSVDGVCKDILALAGPVVEAELKTVGKVNRGSIMTTSPGKFPCKAILHVCGEKDASVIETLACSILVHCDSCQYKSVAIPAICAGIGGLEPGVVAGAILRGVKSAAALPLANLSDIHLVLYKMDVFLAFQEEAKRMFSSAVISKVPKFAAAVAPQVQQPRPPASASADLSVLDNSAAGQRSSFLVAGLSRTNVDDAKKKLQDLYQNQCSTQTFRKEELEGLRPEDLEQLTQLLDAQCLYAQTDPAGSLTVSGLKDGVNQTMRFITDRRHGSLKQEMRLREEKDLSTRVVWCLEGWNGNWEPLPQSANYSLEKRELAGGIVDAQGLGWTVDLQRLQASSLQTAQPRKLKRLENLPDFTLPLYWDNMAAGETMKKVTLLPQSAEYKTLKQDFKKTATANSVLKIERLQNVHLRRGYEGRKKQISEKNAQDGGACEKLLYHGTSQDSCESIVKTGFNRRFCGQNGTAFGEGVYFAVKASYSAHPTYSKPAADGSRLMFVARVLTGAFGQGGRGLKVPPLLDGQRPHERYDSVVDKMDNPSMYVVFHDNQSYPDYLITFR